MLFKVVLTFQSVDEIQSVTIQLKVLSCGTVYISIMLHKVVLTLLKSTVDEILKCDHSNESYLALLSFSTIYYAVHCFLR